MKKKRILKILGDIDERFIEEADPSNAKAVFKERDRRIIKRRIVGWSAIGAVGSLIVAFALWLFVPYNVAPPSVEQYRFSEYFTVIKKLNEKMFNAPRYKNNYEKYFGGLVKTDAEVPPAGDGEFSSGFENWDDEIIDEEVPETSPGDSGGSSYEEVTDNQVQGVIESDIIKRTDKHIFYLSGGDVFVYSIAKENSKLAATVDVAGKNTLAVKEMFLSTDCKALTVISSCKIDGVFGLEIVSFDVSDVNNITEIKRVVFSSTYFTSRLKDGKLLVLSRFYVQSDMNFEHKESYLPFCEIDGNKSFIEGKNIVSPDILTGSTYIVVCRLDQKTLEIEGFNAFLSYASITYVSNDYVYITRGFTETVSSDSNEVYTEERKTEIIPMTYMEKRFKVKDSITVSGSLKNQYSMDEYQGNLRVVTTTNLSCYKNQTYYREGLSQRINASLYIIDVDKMRVVKSVENFAPDGEEVQSVRFDKNMAYVCTSVVFTDPVFAFDLSDLNNIKVSDTGTIEGYSSSLVNFGGGYLLGIGYTNSFTPKIEIYIEANGRVESVCKYEIRNARISEDYKSYYIDRQNKMIGLAVGGNRISYILLVFDGSSLNEIFSLELQDRNLSAARLVLEDNYVYLLFGKEFYAVAIADE